MLSCNKGKARFDWLKAGQTKSNPNFARMNSSEIDHNGFHLHYYPSGNGEKKLLVFHGYGQKSDDWNHYLKAFETSYTIYYFELFGHGRSLVEKEAEKKGLRHKDWQIIFAKFLQQERIEIFSMIAYSLGAKLGLLTAEFFGKNIEKTILMAPDGVKPDFAQILLLRNQPGRWLLQWFSRHPRVLNRSLFLVHKSGFINRKAHEYFRQQTGSTETRNFVMLIWYTYRHLRPNIRKTMQAALQHNQSFYLIYGKRDSLIHSRYMEAAIGQRPKSLKGDNFALETGHHLMIPEVKILLEKILLSSQ
jgi:pimeloyl-ACP methyl ester carboxylesterase